jgi:hypothetical protein
LAIIPAAAVYTWLALNTAKLPTNLTSSTFSVGDFVNLPSLASQLKQATDPVSACLKGQFSGSTLDLLTNWNHQASASYQTRLGTALVQELNGIINDPSLYDEQRFKGVVLRPETQELIAQKPKGDAVILRNRLLLEDAYALEISRKPILQWKFYIIPPIIILVCFMRHLVFSQGILALAKCQCEFEEHSWGNKAHTFHGIARWNRDRSNPKSSTWPPRLAWIMMLSFSAYLSSWLSGFSQMVSILWSILGSVCGAGSLYVYLRLAEDKNTALHVLRTKANPGQAVE